MPDELICSDCGSTFKEEAMYYGGSYWCSSCRRSHQDAIVRARNKAYEQYRKVYNSDVADRKAMNAASAVQKNRARRSRYYRGT